MSQYTKYPILGGVTALISLPSIGGASFEALTIPGLLASDMILAITQQVSGTSNLPIVGFNTLINNGLTVLWNADPGPNAIVIVALKR